METENELLLLQGQGTDYYPAQQPLQQGALLHRRRHHPHGHIVPNTEQGAVGAERPGPSSAPPCLSFQFCACPSGQ